MSAKRRFGLAALCVALIVTVVAVMIGCDNPGGGDDPFAMFSLTATASPAEGGVISCDPFATRYQNGTSVNITATAAAGFRFAGWSNTSLPQITSVNLIMTSDIDITAYFEPDAVDRFSLTLTPDPGTGGTVSRQPDSPDYAPGTVVIATAAPNTGFRFIGWTGALTSDEYQTAVTMNSNMALTAHFELIPPDQYVLAAVSSPAAGGTVTRNPVAASYVDGAQVTVTATPNSGYTFGGWSDASTSSERIITVTMDDNKQLTAIFIPNQYKLTTSFTPTGGGSITPTPDQTTYDHGTQVSVSAVAADGYVFARWTGASTLSANPLTITMDGNKELNAIFNLTSADFSTLTTHLLPADGSGGTVIVNPNQESYAYGTKVAVTAIPKDGYGFVGWTGSLVSPNTEDTLRITSDMTVTAEFKRVATLNIAKNPPNGGSVTPESMSQHDIGTQVIITAEPNPGFRFNGWTSVNAVTFGNPNNAVTTINLNTDANITANFQAICTLWAESNHLSFGSPTPYISHGDAGFEVTLRITPAINRLFLNWEVVSGDVEFGNIYDYETKVIVRENSRVRANMQGGTVEGEPLFDSRDNKTYRTIVIGRQTWMAQNLNFAGTGGIGRCYDDNQANCDTYGRMYSWSEVMGFDESCNTAICMPDPEHHRGICPAGWSVHSLRAIRDYLVTSNNISLSDVQMGGLLTTADGWEVGAGSNYFGFSALPGGVCSVSEGVLSCNGIGRRAAWWDRTQHFNEPWAMSYNIEMIDNAMGSVGTFIPVWRNGNLEKTNLLSLRCLKND